MDNESDWKSELSEEYRDDPALQDFKDIDGLAKAFKDTKSAIGGMLRIPSEEADDAARAEFRQKLLDKDIGLMQMPDMDDEEGLGALYNKLGRPENAEGYTPIEGMAEDRFKQIAELAHSVGATDKQLQKFMGTLLAADAEKITAAEDARTAELTELKNEWGSAYDQKLERVTNLIEATKAPPMLLDAIKGGKANAATLKWLDGLAASLGSEGAPMAKQLTSVTAETRADIEQLRDDLTRKLQKNTFSPAEEQRLIAKLVSYNERLGRATN